MLDVLLEMSVAVARVNTLEGTGTGFLIARDLLMTNNHVIGSEIAARRCAFQFNHQLDRTGKAMPVHSARALDGGLFRTSPMASTNANPDALDYTVVQLTDVPVAAAPLPLESAAIARESRLAIIQHPGGDYKKISLQNNFVESVDEQVVQYTTSTEPGSSGSPVISDDFKVVAIHHAGGDLSESATRRRYLRNEGVRMSAILKGLAQSAPEIYQRLSR